MTSSVVPRRSIRGREKKKRPLHVPGMLNNATVRPRALAFIQRTVARGRERTSEHPRRFSRLDANVCRGLESLFYHAERTKKEETSSHRILRRFDPLLRRIAITWRHARRCISRSNSARSTNEEEGWSDLNRSTLWNESRRDVRGGRVLIYAENER